jgi:acetoin utilization protein AcuB
MTPVKTIKTEPTKSIMTPSRIQGFMREIIQRNPVTISPDASLLEARHLIHERGVRHLPVVDENKKVVGIVRERDIQAAAPQVKSR